MESTIIFETVKAIGHNKKVENLCSEMLLRGQNFNTQKCRTSTYLLEYHQRRVSVRKLTETLNSVLGGHRTRKSRRISTKFNDE